MPQKIWTEDDFRVVAVEAFHNGKQIKGLTKFRVEVRQQVTRTRLFFLSKTEEVWHLVCRFDEDTSIAKAVSNVPVMRTNGWIFDHESSARQAIASEIVARNIVYKSRVLEGNS